MRIPSALRRWLTAFLKVAGDLVDIFKPRGRVEMRLIYAGGPRKGEVARVIRGRNVITGFLKELSTNNIYSGRDVMRRLLVPSTFTGSLTGDVYRVSIVELGSGNAAETSSDEELETPIPGSQKDITSVEFHASNPYVTFITEYDETEVNTTISEAALENANGDFLARKTFSSFPKTSEFTLQVRWEIRF
jgi:hypothetical protein